MPKLTPPRAILFDWHGTLVDTFEAMYRAVDEVLFQLVRLGLAHRLQRPGHARLIEHEMLIQHVRRFRRLPQALKATRQMSRTEIFEILFGTDEDAKLAVHEAFDQRYLRHFGQVRPFEPGVRTMLRALRQAGLVTGVLTNRRRKLLLQELAKVDGGWQELFEVIVCGDDVPRRKPAPDIVLRACSELRMVPGAEVWFVGDSTTDTSAAKQAGVTAIYYNGAKWDPSHLVRIFPGGHRPDAIAADFAALQALALPRRSPAASPRAVMPGTPA